MIADERRHHAENRGHETRDVTFRPIVLSGLALLALLVAVGLLGALMREHYERREATEGAPASPLAADYGMKEPPAPRLQTDPLQDLRDLRAAEDALLHGYGWVDRGAGTVRIPIDRAIERLAEQARTAPRR
jgi:hypothetical protein